MQIFQLLTQNEKIVVIHPYNPFAQGIVEQINAHPLNEQTSVIDKALKVNNLQAKLELVVVNGTEAINTTYNIIIYQLTIF